MATESLLEDCQTVIAKGHESWKSYFSKWEHFAKCEEDIPEDELFDTAVEKCKPKKMNTKKTRKKQQKPLQTKPSKKNQKTRRKLNKKKTISSGSKQEVTEYSNNENSNEKEQDVHLETILKNVFTEFLKANKTEFQMFAVLSQTFDSNCSQFFQPQHNYPKPLELTPTRNINRSICPNRDSYIENLYISHSLLKPLTPTRSLNRSICPNRDSYIENLHVNHSLLQGVNPPMEWENTAARVLNNSFPNRTNTFERKLLLSMSGSPTLKQTPQINIEMRNCNPVLQPRFSNIDTKLKSLKWDLSLKSPSSVCRKINKEYFIKRNFLKMNITQDGKRFRNLCLRKRTNSVTLSMENSNFTTPERKPPERKCFSENVLQGKARRPSKLFFGNEEEDSESDDQTVTHAPIIRCKNTKTKTQIIPEAPESDSDDCESIFDRVKT